MQGYRQRGQARPRPDWGAQGTGHNSGGQSQLKPSCEEEEEVDQGNGKARQLEAAGFMVWYLSLCPLWVGDATSSSLAQPRGRGSLGGAAAVGLSPSQSPSLSVRFSAITRPLPSSNQRVSFHLNLRYEYEYPSITSNCTPRQTVSQTSQTSPPLPPLLLPSHICRATAAVCSLSQLFFSPSRLTTSTLINSSCPRASF